MDCARGGRVHKAKQIQGEVGLRIPRWDVVAGDIPPADRDAPVVASELIGIQGNARGARSDLGKFDQISDRRIRAWDFSVEIAILNQDKLSWGLIDFRVEIGGCGRIGARSAGSEVVKSGDSDAGSWENFRSRQTFAGWICRTETDDIRPNLEGVGRGSVSFLEDIVDV